MSTIDKQALRERYSEKPAPKCHICGSVMTIQRAGAGSVVYGCTGRIDKDGEGYNLLMAETSRNDHYARSRVMVANESDSDVLALLDELENKEEQRANWFQMAQKLGEDLDAAENRIAELSASHRKLRNTMAGIHNTIRMDGGYTPLAAILNAAKRAYEESASAAGIRIKGE
ncbi:TPA: ead/Ea22-like family protein [Shigella flexneri]|nr:ead/Ea22-like family protein [Shigella flexneri]